MFQTITKKYVLSYTAHEWQQTIRNREIAKNNYRATGDMKKAKAFANSIAMYKPPTHVAEHKEYIIFNFEGSSLAPQPAYRFVN